MAPANQTWLVVGASRGIGREFGKQLLERGDALLATVRKKTSQHEISYWTGDPVQSSLCSVFEADMLNEQTIDALVAQLAAIKDLGKVDHVLINAGVLKYPNRATELSYEDFAYHVHTNAIGPIICAQRLLKAGLNIGCITFMSSDSSSSGRFRDDEDGFAAYGASKGCLNMMARHMAAELSRKGSETIILLLHPGEVKTDMANVNLGWEVHGQISPEESVSACLKTIESKGLTDSGSFWTFENKPYPW